MKAFVKDFRVGDIYEDDNIRYIILNVREKKDDQIFVKWKEMRKEENNRIFVKWSEDSIGFHLYRVDDYWSMDKKINSEPDVLDYI